MDTIEAPPARAPRPAVEERALTGKRLVVAFRDEDLGLVQYAHDYRAASECFEEGGRTYVRVVTEVQWYAWVTDPDPNKTPQCPRAKAWPAELVWVE